MTYSDLKELGIEPTEPKLVEETPKKEEKPKKKAKE